MDSKLVLHFDINGTITAIDSVDDITVRENANLILSKNTLIDVNGDKVSYYNYAKKNYPDEHNTKCYQFTDSKFGSQYKDLCDQLVKKLESGEFFFQSFIKILEEFPDAIIVLRSFGKDIPQVLKRLSHDMRFKNCIKGTMIYESESIIKFCGDEFSGCKNFNELNDFYFDTTNHIAVQEDYHRWNSNNRHALYGKIIKSDPRLFQIFFDDNECVHLMDDGNGKIFYIKVNTIDAWLNEDYFIDQIRNLI